MLKRSRLLAVIGIALAAGAFALWWHDGGDDSGSSGGTRYGYSGGQFFPGAGLTAVQHDGTLSGSGTTTSLLSVVGGGGTVTSSGASPNMAVFTSGTNIGSYAGSAPSACTAGQAETNDAFSASGALTHTCTTLISGTNTDLVAFIGANTVGNFAGSSPSACTAGQALTNEALSAAGGLTNTCTTLLSGTSNTLTKFTGPNAVGNGLPTDDGTTLTTNENFTATGAGAFSGVQTNSTTGSQNDFALTSTISVLRLTNASASTLTGITGGAEGRLLVIEASGAGTVTLTNDSGSSAAANRIYAEQGSNTVLVPGSTSSTAILAYNSTATHWLVISSNSSTRSGAMTFSGGATFNSGNVTISSGNLIFSAPSGHVSIVGGTAPTLGTCGTSPSITGSDVAGRITTGSAATTCTITFGATYTNAPSCSVHAEGTATQPTYTTSATAITMTVDIASTVYDYICVKVS